MVSEAKRKERLYGVAFKGANLLKILMVRAASMSAVCLLTLVETTDTAEAASPPQNGKIDFWGFQRNGHSTKSMP